MFKYLITREKIYISPFGLLRILGERTPKIGRNCETHKLDLGNHYTVTEYIQWPVSAKLFLHPFSDMPNPDNWSVTAAFPDVCCC